MKAPRFVAISRAWLRKTIRNNRDVDVGLGGPKLKLSFKQDEPVETRTGIACKQTGLPRKTGHAARVNA